MQEFRSFSQYFFSMHNKRTRLYGISLVFWASFLLLEESSPAGARQVRQTIEFAGTILPIRTSPRQRPTIGHKSIFCVQSETSIGMSRGTG